MVVAKAELRGLAPVTNDAAESISFEEPYVVSVKIEGTTAIIFHRWSCEDVAEKSRASKNSKAKKTDNIESYVYRNDRGEICLPGEYLRLTICNAAKFKQDPRSPRKSAFDLFKAGVVAVDELCPINGGVKDWDFVDQRRMQIQRSSITRLRPAFAKGWTAECRFEILVPEYIDPQLFNEILVMGGRLIGTADSRPSYGRFQVNSYEVLSL